MSMREREPGEPDPGGVGPVPSAEDDEVEDDRTDSVPRVAPEYADEDQRQLGERLAALYHQRDVEPEADLDGEIDQVRRRLRRGPRLHPGEFLGDGRYRLLQRLSRGGVDAYWKAWDRQEGILVFVRVFHAGWVADDDAFEAFTERGRELGALDHPGIGRVLVADRSDDGFVYLATEFFSSGSLASRAELDTTACLQVLVELAQALGYAHDQQVVHGDVRPGNVMFSSDGAAHVVGFSVTPPDRDAGSSLFRSPESTERGYEPAPSADVYAVGMTVMSALNGGDLPFWVLRDPQRLLDSLDVGETVRNVLTCATEWDLDKRYATMSALAEELLGDDLLVQDLARRARENGRYPVAAEHYETLLRIQPSRAVEIHTILGDVYTAMGSYDQAFEHLIGALERTPDVESLFPALRLVAERTGDWARLAEALWAQARAREAGRRVVLRIELARINEHKLDNPSAAAETWEQVLTDHRTPDQAQLALRSMQDLAEQREDWRAFVDTGTELLEYLSEDERAEVEYGIGKVLLEHLDDEDGALQWIDRAEERGYTEVAMAPRLQGIRARRGQWQRVIQLMVQQAEGQEIAEASPTLLRAGIIASSVHHEEAAFRVYHALLERAPRHVVALRHLARLHHRAHEHDRALDFYGRLWESYKGRDSEEPEASERAADCCAYAGLLLKRGEIEAAAERLDEALRLNPNHVPSLQLAGPLFLGRGDTRRAGVVFDRLLSLFKSVERSTQKIEACLGMGDLAWVQGRLTAAMGWFNRALELDPFSVRGWWGLSKVAMAARGGHPGADRAPWVMAMPKRYTGHEALARLLAGLIDPASLRRWLEHTLLGQALIEGGDTPMRLACAVVDVMARNEIVSPDLFQRLADACPEWSEPVAMCQRLWFEGGASTFPVARSYTWSARSLDADFDPAELRSVLPPELAPPPVAIDDLRAPAVWRALFSGDMPPAPEPFTMIEHGRDDGVELYPGPVGALVRDGVLWLALTREELLVGIGSATGNDLRIVDDAAMKPHHARMRRQGGRIYLETVDDGARLQVDGEDRDVWRLVGGERVTLGETRLRFEAYEDATQLPLEVRAEPPADAEPVQADDEPISVERDLRDGDDDHTVEAAEPPPAEPVEDVTATAAEAHDDTVPAAAIEPTVPSGGEPPPAEPVSDDAEDDSEELPRDVTADGPPPGPIGTPVPAAYSLRERPGAPDDGLPVPLSEAEAPEEEPEPSLAPVVVEPLDEEPEPSEADEEEPELIEATEPLPPAPEPEQVDEEPEQVDEEPEQVDEESGPELPPAAADLPPEVSSLPPVEAADLSDDGDLPDEPSEEEVVRPRMVAQSERQGPMSPAPLGSSVESVAGTPQDEPQRPPVSDLPHDEAESEESEPEITDDAPAWLRQALAAEEAIRDEEAPSDHGLVAEETFDISGPAHTVEIPDDDELEEDDDAPEEPVRPTAAEVLGLSPPSADPAEPEVEPVSEPEPELVDEEPEPPSAPQAPSQLGDLRTDEPPVRDVPPTGVFGFTEISEEVPEADAGKTPAGVSGPTAVPPKERDAGPPASSLFMAVPNQGTAVLEYMSGAERGQQVPVGESLSVGQSRSCGMSIPSDSRLSPTHCRVRRTASGYVLSDEGSANGTVVNGARVDEVPLTGGEVIMVGRTVLRFRILEGGA